MPRIIPQTFTVLIADPGEIFRHGISRALQDEPDLELVWDGDMAQAVAAAEAFQPDVALVDIGLPQQRGLKIAWQIRMRNPATATLILSPFEDDAQIFQSAKIGASGFASKVKPPMELMDQIREIGAGANLIGDILQVRPGVANQMIRQFESYDLAGRETSNLVSPLTNRER
jgi:DNA-binding NarL/FixJ family response regulator